MHLATFKKALDDVLLETGFTKKGEEYYLDNEELTRVVGLQKSQHSNSYYVNIGYVIRKLNPDLRHPHYFDGDVRARFTFDKAGRKIDVFDLGELSEIERNALRGYFESNVQRLVSPVTSITTLRSLLEENPVMLYQTKLVAKELLGLK